MSIVWDNERKVYIGKFKIDSAGNSQSYTLEHDHHSGPLQTKMEVEIQGKKLFSSTFLDCELQMEYIIDSPLSIDEGESLVVNVSTTSQNFLERKLHWSIEPIDSSQGNLNFLNTGGHIVLTESNPSKSFTIQSIFDSADNVFSGDTQEFKIIIEDKDTYSSQYTINSDPPSSSCEYIITVRDNMP